ncbi:MAG: DUF4350 domain-containing protein [Pseudomonadota bacterium]|nr:DUF4350 domain-containing protein [Pseudomonadota bacterium]
MIRGPVIVFALLVALAGGLTWLFFNTFERREEDVNVGYRGEARSNELLAAERFLGAMALEVDRLGSAGRLGETLPAESVVVMVRRRASDSPQGVARRLDWIEAGGHLVVAARHHIPPGWEEVEGPVAVPDDLLDALGIEVVTGFLSEEQAAEATVPAVELADGDGFVEVDFDPAWRLQVTDAADAVTHAGEFGIHVVRSPRGEGKVTVLSDMDFATNEAIGRADHAEFLWRLLRTETEPPRRIWFMAPENMAAFWVRLWHRSWMLIASLALLLVAWIASAAPRFGPLVPTPVPGRRSLIEHVDASGRYYWRSGGGDRLLGAVETALLREAGHRRKAVCARLNAALGSRHDESSPFPSDAGSREAPFTNAVNAMETIRRHL